MEALAILRLTPPPGRKHRRDAPETSPPSSPRHAFTMEEVEEAPLGEVRAAIPFLWELTPGTPKDDFEMHVEEAEDDSDDHSLDDPAPLSSPSPLRLPPRLQHLQSFSSCSSSKLMSEVTILGMHERKQQRIRSLSPLRFLSADRSNLSPETSFDSVSSSFSSSSSSSSPQALRDGSLNDLVPDVALSSTTPRMVESRREKRSPARARSMPSSSRREHLGRALFANRLGLLCSCLGEFPQHP